MCINSFNLVNHHLFLLVLRSFYVNIFWRFTSISQDTSGHETLSAFRSESWNEIKTYHYWHYTERFMHKIKISSFLNIFSLIQSHFRQHTFSLLVKKQCQVYISKFRKLNSYRTWFLLEVSFVISSHLKFCSK